MNSVMGAMEKASQVKELPFIGEVNAQRVQICPQNAGRIDESLIDELKLHHPLTEFRFHANVWIMDRLRVVDLINDDKDYWARLCELNRYLGAPAYVAHPGFKKDGTLKDLFRRTRDIEDKMQVPVGIEGMYPSKTPYLIDSAKEYEELLLSGCHFALDLSHLNIRRDQSRIPESLIREMISSSRCIEVHVSGNDGFGDQHKLIEEPPWWLDILPLKNEKAVVFSESNLRISK